MMFYRKLNRQIAAMSDPWPQRMLPLSKGIREGNPLRSAYHELKLGLGGGGVAKKMPLKNEPVNAHIRAQSYITHERQQGQMFAENKVVLEAQRPAIRANANMRLNAYSIDQGGVSSRQLITRAIKAQAIQKEDA